MNKLAIALSAALSLGAVTSASAADAVINFEGTIEALTCDIGVGAGVDHTLTMATISPTAIISGAAARQQSFELTMGTDAKKCAAGDVTLSFEDENLDTDGFLTNTETVGGAPGVRMAIRDGSGPLNLRTHTLSATIDSAIGTATFPLTASYEPIAGETPANGSFKSALHVSVKY
ncbi:TPA: fimbrial protein [Stenotrophomonas maltophilia]